MGICEYHEQLTIDIAVIKNDVSYIKSNFCQHIKEANEKNGFRDRLLIAEQSISELKKAMWIRVVVSGLIGGLIGSGSSDVVRMFLQWIMNR